MTAACPDCGGESAVIGGLSGIVHAFSCRHRGEGDQARCDNAGCRKLLDHDLVVRWGKKTCDEKCRAERWKDESGYGRLYKDPSPAKAVRTASPAKRSKGSGRQVSFLKAVDGCADALVECGVEPDEAILLAEKHMRRKLSAKQLAELEAAEREPDPEPAPMVLPAMVMEPTVAAVPDPEPAAEDEPSVRILQRRRDDYDRPEWVEIATIPTRASAGVALTTWLEEQYPEPLTGSYRAEGNGSEAETDWQAAAA